MVKQDFLIDEVLVFRDLQAVELEIEVVSGHEITSGLVVRLVEIPHKLVSKSLLDSDTLGRVKSQHPLHQINRVWVDILEQGTEVYSFLQRKLTHEFFVIFVLDCGDELLRWRAHEVVDHKHQVLLVLRRKQGLAPV